MHVVKANIPAWFLVLQGVPLQAPYLEHILFFDYKDLERQLDGHLVSKNLILQLMSLLVEARRLDFGLTFAL